MAACARRGSQACPRTMRKAVDVPYLTVCAGLGQAVGASGTEQACAMPTVSPYAARAGLTARGGAAPAVAAAADPGAGPQYC